MSSNLEREKRRLERLKKDLDEQQKKLDDEKTRLRQEKKQMEAEKNKVQRQEKMLKVQKNAATRSPNMSPRGSDRPRMSLSKQPRVQKLERELGDFKKRYEMKVKQARDEKARVEELEGEIRILKRKLKNAKLNTAATDGNEARQVKTLQREIRVLKKQLKLAMKDLDKQRNYYLAQLRKFKDNQEKWVRLQKEAMKKKNVIVKYIFLDDIRTIKVYPKRERLRHKVRLQTEKGEDVVVYIQDVKMWAEGDENPDEDSNDKDKDLDAFMEELEKELKPYEDDDGKVDKEPEEEEEEDEEDEDVETSSQEQINRLLTELHNRATDLHRIHTIYKEEPAENYEKDLKELLEQVQNRHRDFVNKMEQLQFDPEDLKEVNKSWEDEIYKFKEAIDQAISAAPKGHDDSQKSAEPPLLSLDGSEEQTGKPIKESLLTACKQCMEELTGRIGDLMNLNDIYFHPEHDELNKDLARNDRLEQLENAMKDRHRAQQTILAKIEAVPDDEFLEEFNGGNKAWRDLIHSVQSEFEKGETQAEQYVDELQNRTNDLKRVLKVMKGDEANSFLEGVRQDVKERHEKQHQQQQQQKSSGQDEETDGTENVSEAEKKEDNNENVEKEKKETDVVSEDNKHWQQLIEEIIQVREHPSSLAHSAETGTDNDFKDEVIQELLTELKKRRDDVLNIKDMNTSVPEECEGLLLETETRHGKQKEKLRDAKKRHTTTGDEQKDVVEMQRRESILETIATDNNEWKDSLSTLLRSAQQGEAVVKEHQVALDELNGRINDLLKLKHMLENKANKETKPDELLKSGEVLVSSLSERQREAEANVEKMLSETKTGDEKRDEKSQDRLNKLKENNEEWKDAILSSVNTVTDDKASEVHEEKHDMWWLDKNEERKNHIDSFTITTENEKEVELIGTYVNRLFHDTDDPIVCLYTPQPKLDVHHILSALYDCELLCEIVNLVEAEFVDARVIHKPDALKPYPISDKFVKENAQLLFASLKAFGVNIANNDEAFSKWSNSFSHFEILQKVINELHTKKLKNYVNLKEDPEIKELKDASESEEDIVRLMPQEWLKRWLNSRLGKPVNTPIEDYTETLYAVMKALDPAFATSAPVETFNADPTMASQHMVRFARTKWGINVYLQANDLVSHHQKLQELFAAQIFEVKSGMEKKSKTKKVRGGAKAPASADDGMISFINSVLPTEMQINELSRDMSDGIVLCRLLDKMKPGCIHWKAVQLKPRQKFDKIGNCNYAMGVCGKEFPFSLVGIGGEDVHNGNQKMVHSLLWQMMRYWSTKKLSELSFGGKDVKDEDILQWANLTISGLRDRHSSEIRSFKDKKLTTAVFYLELLKAVLGDEHVRNELIFFNIPILSNPRAPDEHSKERLANARYAMTIIRMNGADLFILPEDLIALDNKAVLSTLAAIMTIAFTQDKFDHENVHDEVTATISNELLNG